MLPCNIFWNLFGTTKNVTKYGWTLGPRIYHTNIWSVQENMGTSLQHIIFPHMGVWNSENVGRFVHLSFLNVYFLISEVCYFEILKFERLRYWHLENRGMLFAFAHGTATLMGCSELNRNMRTARSVHTGRKQVFQIMINSLMNQLICARINY